MPLLGIGALRVDGCWGVNVELLIFKDKIYCRNESKIKCIVWTYCIALCY
jgi:hypothetical protein